MLAFIRATAKWPIRITSAEWLMPKGMNLHTACSHANVFWRYSDEENKSKSSICICVLYQVKGTERARLNNVEAGASLVNLVALPLLGWLWAKAGVLWFVSVSWWQCDAALWGGGGNARKRVWGGTLAFRLLLPLGRMNAYPPDGWGHESAGLVLSCCKCRTKL